MTHPCLCLVSLWDCWSHRWAVADLFYERSGVSNSDLCACVDSALSTEPSPQTRTHSCSPVFSSLTIINLSIDEMLSLLWKSRFTYFHCTSKLNIHFHLLISGNKAKSFFNKDMFKQCERRPLSQPHGVNTPRSVFGTLQFLPADAGEFGIWGSE